MRALINNLMQKIETIDDTINLHDFSSDNGHPNNILELMRSNSNSVYLVIIIGFAPRC